ncbi:MAG: hypothetical protein LV477_03485 [Candidatus Nitrosotalea sp.]|nr:hypothetical protein [Candidatus Nitrosotalea sp.]
MIIKKCPQCTSEDIVQNSRPHVLMEQGYTMLSERQNGIEVLPVICKNCGFVMLFQRG